MTTQFLKGQGLISPKEHFAILTEEAAKLAETIVHDAMRYPQPDAVVALALLAATIAMHKEAALVSRANFLKTAAEYWDIMKITTTEGEKQP